ncbi:MAG TPA: alkaline phosphatase family protein [Gaiellales bacterium]|nr:alkaline phosphatase family protein [Gaiellales bacterium]
MAGIGALEKIQHIVVLMMENRSFDHMLGYLRNDGMPDVCGLVGDESNTDTAGTEHRAFEYPPEPFPDSFDPCHAPECVANQLADGNAGFITNFEWWMNQRNVTPPPDPGYVMGHYTAQHLPVYDFLARNFCVCDAWHSSIPGDTMPNRLYSIAGRAAEPVGADLGNLPSWIPKKLRDTFADAPIYDVPAFTRQLQDGDWRWYSHDPATLRAVDGRYRSFPNLDRDNFAWFDKKEISLAMRLAEGAIVLDDSFLDDAAKGNLRKISWIDPNFVNLRVFDSASNDDHPPSHIHAGQQLVLTLYDALARSPRWNDTLLVITYDEHGGFYDHVSPPAVPADDGSQYPTLGVRVPALVIGPRVRKQVCHTQFDHTTLISTILRRFAANPDKAVAAMGKRTQRAEHLGGCLRDSVRRDIPSHSYLHEVLAGRRMEARALRRPANGLPSPAADGAGHPMQLHDFQTDFLKFALLMRHAGLRPGTP